MKAVMEPSDHHLADEYVEEFVLDHLDVPVKRENNNNPEEESREMQSQRTQRLPPMPLVGPVTPHMLTPPTHGVEDVHHQHYHQHQQQIVGQNMVHHIQHAQNMVVTQTGVVVSAIKQNSLVMYPNTPGTPPDTPPISISPNMSSGSPQSHYHIEQHVHHVKQPGIMEDMGWLTQSLRQEPLDLRPQNLGDMEDVQWPSQHSVIAGGRRGHQHGDYHHHHHHGHGHQHDEECMRPMSVGEMSPMGSVRGHHHSQPGDQDIISDDMLVHLTVRELNKKLHGLPREEVTRLKAKRRTLKNRGYAQNCRSKRLVQRHELELSNRSLQDEIHRLQVELNRCRNELDMFKHRFELMHCQQVRMDGSDGVPSSGHSNPSSPELF